MQLAIQYCISQYEYIIDYCICFRIKITIQTEIEITTLCKNVKSTELGNLYT